MSKFKQLEKEKIVLAIKEGKSIPSILKNLECNDNSLNRKDLKNFIENNNINISHLKIFKKPITKKQYEQNPKHCKYCGKEIEWEYRRNDFCNHSCAASYNNLDIIRNNTTSKDKLYNITDSEFINIINNSKGWKEISTALGYSNIVGSNIKDKIKERCNNLHLNLNLTKESFILNITKGELLDNRKNYLSYRSSIRKLAEKIYKNSNKPCECAICQYNKHIEIAHIKAVSDFDNNTLISEINNPNNLIALCPNHHWEYDNGYLNILPYIKK